MGPCEIARDKSIRQADGVKNLRPAIRLIGRNAHFGHDLQQAFADGFDEALFDFVIADLLIEILGHGGQSFKGQIGIDRFRAITGKAGKVMHFAGFTGLDHQTNRCAQTFADQMVMNSSGCQQSRNRNAIRPHHTVRQDDDIVTTLDRRFGAFAQTLKRPFHATRARLGGIGDVQCLGVERVFEMTDAADLFQIPIGQDRLTHFKTLAP